MSIEDFSQDVVRVIGEHITLSKQNRKTLRKKIVSVVNQDVENEGVPGPLFCVATSMIDLNYSQYAVRKIEPYIVILCKRYVLTNIEKFLNNMLETESISHHRIKLTLTEDSITKLLSQDTEEVIEYLHRTLKEQINCNYDLLIDILRDYFYSALTDSLDDLYDTEDDDDDGECCDDDEECCDNTDDDGECCEDDDGECCEDDEEELEILESEEESISEFIVDTEEDSEPECICESECDCEDLDIEEELDDLYGQIELKDKEIELKDKEIELLKREREVIMKELNYTKQELIHLHQEFLQTPSIEKKETSLALLGFAGLSLYTMYITLSNANQMNNYRELNDTMF